MTSTRVRTERTTIIQVPFKLFPNQVESLNDWAQKMVQHRTWVGQHGGLVRIVDYMPGKDRCCVRVHYEIFEDLDTDTALAIRHYLEGLLAGWLWAASGRLTKPFPKRGNLPQKRRKLNIK